MLSGYSINDSPEWSHATQGISQFIISVYANFAHTYILFRKLICIYFLTCEK